MTVGALEAVEAALDDLLAPGLPDASPLIHLTRWAVDHDAWAHRLLCDPVFALEMRVCARYGLRHSALLEWSDTDRAKAVAYEQYEARRCKDCGIHPAEWPPEAELPPFEPEAEECPACAELARYQRWLRGQTENNEALADGVKVRFRRRKAG